MTDLHEGRGPKPNKRARALLWIGVFVLLASEFADRLGSTPLIENLLFGVGMATVVVGPLIDRKPSG